MNRTSVLSLERIGNESSNAGGPAGDPRSQCSRVTLPSRVADALDTMLSPMDATFALDEIVLMLPSSHRAPRLARLLRLFGLARVCVGRIAWCGVDFSYVESDGCFIVLDAWPSACRTRHLTCVLDDGDQGSEAFPTDTGAACVRAAVLDAPCVRTIAA